MKKLRTLLPLLFLILLILTAAAVPAAAEEAENLTEGLTVKVVDKPGKIKAITDGKYTSFWESSSRKNPWITLTSDKPIYGLYLCFQKLPDSYVIQKPGSDGWITVAEGGEPRYHHVFIELNGLKEIRILSTMDKKNVMGFNEIFAFGEGDVPDWVQRWEEPVEKADLMVMVAHPDDELLFTGGAIPVYGTEKGKRVEVVFLTFSNTTRRSEALNGLWRMGVRNYPVFGPFSDRYSNGKSSAAKLKAAYQAAGGQKKVTDWVNEQFRRFKPDVVITHAENGEYGHAQHIMAADAAMQCFSKAADATESAESALKYGTWQVKKLYLHMWGEESEQTILDWDQPLAAFDGKTGAQIAAEAFELHASQHGMGMKIKGKFVVFSVEDTGRNMFPYDHFGLQNTTVGPDEAKNDFLEHIAEDEEAATADVPEEPAAEPTEALPETGTAEAGGAGDPAEAEEPEEIQEIDEETIFPSDRSDPETGEESNPTGQRFRNVSAPDWANVVLNENGFLDEGEYIFANEEEGQYIYVNPTIRVVIERTYVTYEKAQKSDPDQEFYCFTADVWCDTESGELPHTVHSNPEKPRKDPGFIKDIATEQKIVFATSTDYYTYRAGRAKEDRSRHVGIEIRNGEILYDDPMIKEEQMPNYETLALYQDGHGESYPSKERSAEEYQKDGATEVFTFGPCLVRNGELSEYITSGSANRSNNPRLAIGVAEPGHYIVVLCEGRVGKDDKANLKRSTGVMMENLANIMLERGCTIAVNMDGGQTAVFAFMGKQINRVVKSDPKGRKQVEALAFGMSEQVGQFELQGIQFKK